MKAQTNEYFGLSQLYFFWIMCEITNVKSYPALT